MKTDIGKFQEVAETFSKLEPILGQLDAAHIPYAIGGSVALYVQGNNRKPKDVDIMFTDEAFKEANKLFGIEPEHIERPYNSMNKSTAVDDGSVDFLNRYTSKDGNRTYYSPPMEVVPVSFKGKEVALVAAEKIAVFKLITRRNHHNDLEDFRELFQNPNFSMDIFWRIADSLGAHETVARLLDNQT